MSVRVRDCLSCNAVFFDDNNARCPTCDAASWDGIKGARERVLAARQAMQRKLAAQWQVEQVEQAERRLGQ